MDLNRNLVNHIISFLSGIGLTYLFLAPMCNYQYDAGYLQGSSDTVTYHRCQKMYPNKFWLHAAKLQQRKNDTLTCDQVKAIDVTIK